MDKLKEYLISEKAKIEFNRQGFPHPYDSIIYDEGRLNVIEGLLKIIEETDKEVQNNETKRQCENDRDRDI
ncbi:MAG: hypothetical protein KBF12_02920 [Sebaldella sp.]|nr:hypothetical protein [Sebaldella sp.]